MTFIAANLGAKNKENIKKTMLFGLIWGAIICGIMALLTVLLHRQLLSLFVDNEEALKAGQTRLFILGLPYFFDFTMLLTAAILRGLKHSAYPMMTTMICCSVLRIVLVLTLFKLDYFHTLFWLYALFPITWVLATASNIIAMLIFVPKEFKKIDESIIRPEITESID